MIATSTSTRSWSGTDTTTSDSGDLQYVRIPIYVWYSSTDTSDDFGFNTSDTVRGRKELCEDERKDYWKRVLLKWKAQWILREGPFIRYDPPQLASVQKTIMFRKILRCNRKGIGLRIKRGN